MKTTRTLFTALLLTLFAGTAFAQEEGAPGPGPGPGPGGPVYVDLGEPVMVNVYDQGVLHFVSIDVVAQVADPSGEIAIQDFMTPIRHDLMMLYSSQEYTALYQADTKRRLLDETRKVMQEILQKEAGRPVVEEVFFNAFVIQ